MKNAIEPMDQLLDEVGLLMRDQPTLYARARLDGVLDQVLVGLGSGCRTCAIDVQNRLADLLDEARDFQRGSGH